VQKNVQNCTPDTKASLNVKIGNFERGQNFGLKMRAVQMLKWGRWGKREKGKNGADKIVR